MFWKVIGILTELFVIYLWNSGELPSRYEKITRAEDPILFYSALFMIAVAGLALIFPKEYEKVSRLVRSAFKQTR